MKRRFIKVAISSLLVAGMISACEPDNDLTKPVQTSESEESVVETSEEVETTAVGSAADVIAAPDGHRYSASDDLFILSDDEFYDIIASNPIDQKFTVDYDSGNTQTIVEGFFNNRNEWENQALLDLSVLREAADVDIYDKLEAAWMKWGEYSSNSLSADQDMFYPGGICGSSMAQVTVASIANERSRQYTMSLMAIEYYATKHCDFIQVGDADSSAEVYRYDLNDLSVYIESDINNVLKERSSYGSSDAATIISGINSECDTIASYADEGTVNKLRTAVDAYLEYADLMKQVEAEIDADRADRVYITRLQNLLVEMVGRSEQLKLQLG